SRHSTGKGQYLPVITGAIYVITNQQPEIFREMKNYFFRSYNRVIILIWTIIFFLVWVQFKDHYPPLPALSLITRIFIPTLLISYFLSNRLLQKAMYHKKMNDFIGW